MGRSAVACAARRARVDARVLRKRARQTALPDVARTTGRSRDTPKVVASRRIGAARALGSVAAAARVAGSGQAVSERVAAARAGARPAAAPAIAAHAPCARAARATRDAIDAAVRVVASDDAGLSGAAPSAGAGPAPNGEAAPEFAREVGAGVARHAAEAARAGLVSVLTGAERVAAASARARVAARRRHAGVGARDDEAIPGHVRNAGDRRSSVGRERISTAATTAAPAPATEEEECVEQQYLAERTHGANRHPGWEAWSRSLE